MQKIITTDSFDAGMTFPKSQVPKKVQLQDIYV